jgi:hypothetical protein
MAGQVYFGNETFQTYIPAPLTGMNASSVGFSSEGVYLNGRSFGYRSKGSHRRFDMSWVGSLNSSLTAESLQTIKDFADGIYGDGPFYWVDPYATNTNILAPHVAAPQLTADGWPAIADANFVNGGVKGDLTITNISGDGTTVTVTTSSWHWLMVGQTVTIIGVNPTAYNITGTVASVQTATNVFTITNAATGSYVSGGTVKRISSFGYPANPVQFTVTSASAYNSTVPVATIIIPSDKVVWFGLKMAVRAGSPQLYYERTNRATGEVTTGTFATGSTTMNTDKYNGSFTGATYSMVKIYLRKNTTSNPLDIAIYGFNAEYVNIGVAEPAGNFVSGRGTTALEFVTSPTIQYYSSAINSGQIGMAATLRETD